MQKGFTLTELLITVGLLGLISIFAIPKLLGPNMSAQKSQSIVRSVVTDVSKAYTEFRLNTNPATNHNFNHILPYLNYVKLITTSTHSIDRDPNSMVGAIVCGNGWRCLLMPSGAILMYNNANRFETTDTTSALWFQIDPDGKAKQSAVTDSPTKSTNFRLYFDGRIKSIGTMLDNTCVWSSGSQCDDPEPDRDPAYWNME